jgi:membrane-bound metal-dependent hydrolase YbcI (DUF457 family)
VAAGPAETRVMIAGHFGLAAGVKGSQPATPLWSLMAATVWLDIVFVPLFLAGLETTETVPGTSGGYGNTIIHADYTHSLVGAIVLSAVYGAFFVRPWGARIATVLAAVSFSHWLLDLLVHRSDLPLLPGNAGGLPLLGFGLWRVPPLAIGLEAVFVVGGALLYWRGAARVSRRAGRGQGRAAALAAGIALAGLVTLSVDALLA